MVSLFPSNGETSSPENAVRVQRCLEEIVLDLQRLPSGDAILSLQGISLLLVSRGRFLLPFPPRVITCATESLNVWILVIHGHCNGQLIVLGRELTWQVERLYEHGVAHKITHLILATRYKPGSQLLQQVT